MPALTASVWSGTGAVLPGGRGTEDDGALRESVGWGGGSSGKNYCTGTKEQTPAENRSRASGFEVQN